MGGKRWDAYGPGFVTLWFAAGSMMTVPVDSFDVREAEGPGWDMRWDYVDDDKDTFSFVGGDNVIAWRWQAEQ